MTLRIKNQAQANATVVLSANKCPNHQQLLIIDQELVYEKEIALTHVLAKVEDITRDDGEFISCILKKASLESKSQFSMSCHFFGPDALSTIKFVIY